MSREETIARIQEHLHSLRGFEPRTTMYTGPEGEIEAVIYDITDMDPRVEFKAKRAGSVKSETFSVLATAFVYLFRQTAHIQR